MSFNDFILGGLSGKNEGIETGIRAFDESFYGILKGKMYVIAAGSSTGKSTLVDSAFFLHPYFHSDKKIKFIYFSFELSDIVKKTKWLNYILNAKEGITLQEEVIAGYGKVKLTKDQLALVNKYIPEVEEIFDSIDFYQDPMNPTGINSVLYEYAERNGTFIKEKYTDREGRKQEKHVGYVPNDPDQRTIIIIDHIGLCSPEKGASEKKHIIDKTSDYLKWFRNLCGFSPVIIQQFNNNLQSINRDPRSQEYYTPQQLDLGGSSYTFQDADVVIGGVNPGVFDIPTYLGYQILPATNKKGLMRSASFWYVMKNRDFGTFKIAALYRPDAPMMLNMDKPDRYGWPSNIS